MNSQEQEAILAIAMMAAFADGNNDERERTLLKSMCESLGAEAASVPRIYQDVLLKRLTLNEAAARLGSPEARQLAFEMAVGVCDADGAHSTAEAAFLASLRQSLGLETMPTAALMRDAATLAAAPVATQPPPFDDVADGTTTATMLASTMSAAELDKTILNYSILNGALELLPQNLASMAIIPLQMKMVYRIGRSYGFDLDKGHIKDFLATAGVGLTSQYLEQFGRRLIGGLLGQVAGGLGRAAGSLATGSMFSFATTYALGMVAKQYYAGGRRLDADSLKQAFSGLLGEAKSLQSKYLPEIREKARTIDVAQLVKEVSR